MFLHVHTHTMDSGNLFTSSHPCCIRKNVLSYVTWYIPPDQSRDGKALIGYKNAQSLQHSFLLLTLTYKL